MAMVRVSKLVGSNINTNYFDHVAAHTGVKRNMCVMCKKRFTYSRDLRAHVSRCHPKTKISLLKKKRKTLVLIVIAINSDYEQL